MNKKEILELADNFSKIGERINNPNCFMEIITDINKSSFLTSKEKEIINLFKDEKELEIIEFFVFKSDDKKIIYLIAKLDKNNLLLEMKDFDLTNFVIFENNNYYKEIKDDFISISILGQDKNKKTILKNIVYMEPLSIIEETKKILKENFTKEYEEKMKNKNFEKDLIEKYSKNYNTVVCDIIYEDDLQVYINNITDEKIEINVKNLEEFHKMFDSEVEAQNFLFDIQKNKFDGKEEKVKKILDSIIKMADNIMDSDKNNLKN